MVIASKANYNLLLGHEWIHGIRAIPSTLHQRLSIWRQDGIVENIEADHSYFTTDMGMVNRKNFDKALATIPLCDHEDTVFESHLDAIKFLTLHPTHGFIWDQEKLDTYPTTEGEFEPTRLEEQTHNDS